MFTFKAGFAAFVVVAKMAHLMPVVFVMTFCPMLPSFVMACPREVFPALFNSTPCFDVFWSAKVLPIREDKASRSIIFLWPSVVVVLTMGF